MKTIKGNKGFTLVELLIVIAIIAILVAIAIPVFNKYREVAARSVVQSDAMNCVHICSAKYAETNKEVPDCECIATKNSIINADSVDDTGNISISITGTMAYKGTCVYDNTTSTIECSEN